MTNPPKYRITVYHPRWFSFNRDRQVSLEQYDKRSSKYKPVKLTDVGVRDSVRQNDK